MSDTAGAAVQGSPRRGRAVEVLLLAVAVAVVAGGLLLDGGGRDTPLPRSPIGFDGLVAWLDSEGVDARSFRGGTLLERDRVGLRVLPLYDGDLAHRRVVPDDRAGLLREEDQVDLPEAVARAKIRLLPTLVALPKWRTGTALAGIAHPDLLRDPANDPVSRGQIDAGGGRLVRSAEGFAAFSAVGDLAPGLRARLYAPQVVIGSTCTPLIGSREAMVLGRCGRGDAGYWLLADPDLLNNHGLALGDNAAVATAVLRRLAAGKPVVVDYSTVLWARADRPPGPDRGERRWADFGRFFGPPFTTLWLGFAGLSGLALWRASVRYGPVLRVGPDGPGAAKAAGIAAKARLLRLTGRDGDLLRAHVAGRLQVVAVAVLGPQGGDGGAPLDRIRRILARRDPVLDRTFAAAVADAESLPSEAAAAEALRHLDRFEIVMERVLHEFGRAPQRR